MQESIDQVFLLYKKNEINYTIQANKLPVTSFVVAIIHHNEVCLFILLN